MSDEPKKKRLFLKELMSIGIVDSPANEDSQVLLFKRADEVEKTIREVDGRFCVFSRDGKNLGCHDSRDEAMSHLRAIEANKEEAEKMAEDPKVAAEERQEEGDMPKKEEATVDTAKRDDDVAKKLEALTKRNEELEKALAVERDSRLTKEWVEKAKAIKHLPVEADEFGPVLKALAQHDVEATAKVVEVISTLSAQVEKGGLFKEIGKGETPEPVTAMSKLEKIGQKLVEDGKAKNIEDGIAKATIANPELYAQYLRETH